MVEILTLTPHGKYNYGFCFFPGLVLHGPHTGSFRNGDDSGGATVQQGMAESSAMYRRSRGTQQPIQLCQLRLAYHRLRYAARIRNCTHVSRKVL